MSTIPAQSTKPVDLRLQGVAYRHKQHQLLTDISTDISSGQLTSIIGPNGAGKSTLLRLLGGLLSASAGEVRLGGQAIGTLDGPARARQIGWLGQFPSDDLPLSLAEYVMLGRRPYLGSFAQPGGADQQRVEAALADFELESLADRPWRLLSGGERQRAGLARLIVQDAPIWLLDEPTNHLDLKHQAVLFGRLRSEAARGRTIVTVLHDLPLAAHWSQQVILLHRGGLLASGTPLAVLQADNLTRAYGWPVTVFHDAQGRWQLQVAEAA